MRLSLVVCTRNRADRLRRCLHAVSGIESGRDWEVIVVDNGSVDATPAVVLEARDTLRVPLRLVNEQGEGVSRARNAGWRAASREIVAFTDDDCYPAPELVDAILDRFEREPELGYLGGAVLPADPCAARVGLVARPEPVLLPAGSFVTPGTVICANLAFRRRVLEDIGGFDPAFAYGNGFSGEDVDAAARASASGWPGRYDPSVVVRHDHGRDAGVAARARSSHARGRGAFYAKCALDPRMRRKYLGGWLRLTAGRVGRRESLKPVVGELQGAAQYLALRARSRLAKGRVGGAAPV